MVDPARKDEVERRAQGRLRRISGADDRGGAARVARRLGEENCSRRRRANSSITIETLDKLYSRTLELSGKHSPHGWRSALRSLAGESQLFDRDVLETALDHGRGTWNRRSRAVGSRTTEACRLVGLAIDPADAMSALSVAMMSAVIFSQRKKPGRGRPRKHFAVKTLLGGATIKKAHGRPRGSQVYSDDAVVEYIGELDKRIRYAEKDGRHLSERRAIEWGVWSTTRDHIHERAAGRNSNDTSHREDSRSLAGSEDQTDAGLMP